MREPEIVTGARETRFEAVQAAEAASAARANSAKPIPEGKVVFQFIAEKYQLQLSAGIEERTADGRLLVKSKPVKLIAEGNFVTLDAVKDAETIKWVRENPYYGSHFWDYGEALEKAKKVREDQAVQILMQMEPEVKAKLIEALQASKKDTLGLPVRNEKTAKL